MGEAHRLLVQRMQPLGGVVVVLLAQHTTVLAAQFMAMQARGRQLQGSEQLIELLKRATTDQCYGTFQAVADAADGVTHPAAAARHPARSELDQGAIDIEEQRTGVVQQWRWRTQGNGSAMRPTLPAWACTWGRGQATDQLRWVPSVGRHKGSAIEPRQCGPTVRTRDHFRWCQPLVGTKGQPALNPGSADQRSAPPPRAIRRYSGRGRSSTRHCCRSATARHTAGCRSSGYRCWTDPGSCRSGSARRWPRSTAG